MLKPIKTKTARTGGGSFATACHMLDGGPNTVHF